MTSKILKQNGKVMYLSTCRPLTDDEKNDAETQRKMKDFDDDIRRKLGASISTEELSAIDGNIPTPEHEYCEDDFEGTPNVPDADEVTPEDLDNCIGAQVNLPCQGSVMAGKVIKRARDNEGNPVGAKNDNPTLDARSCQVEFPDGNIAEYSANVIAENMFAMCDPEGNQHLSLEAIIDHKRDNSAVKFADRFIVVNGRQHHRKTTVGWKLCIQWKDGSTSWERLADLKESHPIELAEHAVQQGIDHEPAFAWWAPHVLKRRDRIIATVNKRHVKRTHKFGFETPKTVERAKEIDKENGNTLWQDAIAKEMAAVRVAFKILNNGQEPPVGHKYMDCHMVFEIKMENNFRRKARLVAGGHMLDAPPILTCSSVVSRETVRVALTMAALNDLEVKASDVRSCVFDCSLRRTNLDNSWT